jgi:DnaJ-class molecular chaperone
MSATRRKKCPNCAGRGALYQGTNMLTLRCPVCHGAGAIVRKTKAARKHERRVAREAACASS